jgi:hypothetical protein
MKQGKGAFNWPASNEDEAMQMKLHGQERNCVNSVNKKTHIRPRGMKPQS